VRCPFCLRQTHMCENRVNYNIYCQFGMTTFHNASGKLLWPTAMWNCVVYVNAFCTLCNATVIQHNLLCKSRQCQVIISLYNVVFCCRHLSVHHNSTTHGWSTVLSQSGNGNGMDGYCPVIVPAASLNRSVACGALVGWRQLRV